MRLHVSDWNIRGYVSFNVYVFIRHFPRSTYPLRRINTPYKYAVYDIFFRPPTYPCNTGTNVVRDRFAVGGAATDTLIS